MKIFIGNLGNQITTDDLFLLFSDFGSVMAANVPKDLTGNSRGFGYVMMVSEYEANNAIETLNKKSFMGQFISVSEAIHSDRFNHKVTMPVI